MTDSISQSAEAERIAIVERLRKMVQRYPEISGYHLQPDPTVVEGIVQGLVRSQLAYGHSYCP
jgi:ferredoxin-thioredoxin reductase catalytic subunit